MSAGVFPVGRAFTSTQAPFFRILSPLPTLWWLILCVSLTATRCLVIRPLNYATSFPACPACRLEITGSLSHRSPMNQFLTINLFISVELPRWLRWLKKKKSACNTGDPGLIPGSGRFPGDRNRYPHPLQDSCFSWGARLSTQGVQGLIAPWHVGSSRIREGTRLSCISGRVLYHWTTREAP